MVHAFITANGKIAVMIGIDATGISANQLCGRFMSAAISQYHHRRAGPRYRSATLCCISK